MSEDTRIKAAAYSDAVMTAKGKINQLLSEHDLQLAYLNGYQQGELDVAQKAAKLLERKDE